MDADQTLRAARQCPITLGGAAIGNSDPGVSLPCGRGHWPVRFALARHRKYGHTFAMPLAVQSLSGLIVIPLIAWVLSEDRAGLGLRNALTIWAVGLACQLAIAALLFGLPGSQLFFQALADGVAALQAATLKGMQFVFGYVAGGPAPFEITQPQNGFSLAFQALPLILLMSVLSRLLYHWGILQRIVAGFAWALRKTLGVGGPLGTGSAANIFVGQIDAPLLIRPYLQTMSRGALFALMTTGMATVAGTVLALYATILEPTIPGATGHLLAASVMSVPAALMISRLMVPEGFSDGPENADAVVADTAGSTMDAISQGTIDGLRLLAIVTAMLVVMVALVALVNSGLGMIGDVGGAPLTIERVFGWACAPLAWIVGIPWSEAGTAGGLIGVKVVLNEFLAYLQMAGVADEALSPRSRLILTYVICGFANFGSLGIMIGGLVAMAPERREEIVSLGPRTILSGTLATLMTGAVVGALTWS